MSPEQLSGIATLITLAGRMSGWPLGMLIFLVIGPWIMSLLISYMQAKRFEAVVKMYESNVKLVEESEELSRDLKEVVIMNTQALTTLNNNIESNQFCPAVRLEKRAEGVTKG